MEGSFANQKDDLYAASHFNVNSSVAHLLKHYTFHQNKRRKIEHSKPQNDHITRDDIIVEEKGTVSSATYSEEEVLDSSSVPMPKDAQRGNNSNVTNPNPKKRRKDEPEDEGEILAMADILVNITAKEQGEKGGVQKSPESLTEETKLKKKKSRARTSPEQLEKLEEIFKTDQMPDQQMRIKLAEELGMTPRRVQIWFQNKRAKLKKNMASQQSTQGANSPQSQKQESIFSDGPLSSRSKASNILAPSTTSEKKQFFADTPFTSAPSAPVKTEPASEGEPSDTPQKQPPSSPKWKGEQENIESLPSTTTEPAENQSNATSETTTTTTTTTTTVTGQQTFGKAKSTIPLPTIMPHSSLVSIQTNQMQTLATQVTTTVPLQSIKNVAKAAQSPQSASLLSLSTSNVTAGQKLASAVTSAKPPVNPGKAFMIPLGSNKIPTLSATATLPTFPARSGSVLFPPGMLKPSNGSSFPSNASSFLPQSGLKLCPVSAGILAPSLLSSGVQQRPIQPLPRPKKLPISKNATPPFAPAGAGADWLVASPLNGVSLASGGAGWNSQSVKFGVVAHGSIQPSLAPRPLLPKTDTSASSSTPTPVSPPSKQKDSAVAVSSD